MKTIAIANQKGGVAKTTTALAMGYGLSKRGYKTLLIDLDPQGSLTGFLNVDTIDKPTVFELLAIQRKNRAEFKDVVINVADKLDFIPADISLEEAVKLLTGEPTAAVYLSNALKRVKGNYDYCVIDTSPSLSLITVNALAAADSVIVPIKPEEASLKGVELLLNTIDGMKPLNAALTVAGFLITMRDRRRKSTTQIIEKIHGIADQHNIPIFSSHIRASASGAAISGNPLDGGSPVAKDYIEFIDEFINIENRESLIV
jgi:chromosome partitioning protein